MNEKSSYEKATSISNLHLKKEASKLAEMLGVSLPYGNAATKEVNPLYNHEVSLENILEFIDEKGMRISSTLVRRYHLSLINRGFIILSGISGTGKTWLAELYAQAINAEYLIVPVAPNWTSNEDLLGFYSPLDNEYKHTSFTRFIIDSQNEYAQALQEGRKAKPHHIILDEMNLARVEYYFAKFLSLMEIRNRNEEAVIDIPPKDKIVLTPNMFFIGTINVDETTHSFADKVFDRAQLLEVEIEPEGLAEFLEGKPYKDIVLAIWNTIFDIAPFAYRVINDLNKYVADAEQIGVAWKVALDDQVLQKILPKIKGTNIDVGTKLEELGVILEEEQLERSLKKLNKMVERYSNYGIVTYF